MNERGYVSFAKGKSYMTGIDDSRLLRHFGITREQSVRLFSPMGCGDAQTPIAAAEYIEQFVERNP